MQTEYITGFQNRKILVSDDCEFDNENLFVQFPGYAYNLSHPFFYYLNQFLYDTQLNQISFHFNWSEEKTLFRQPKEQVFKTLEDEIASAFEYIERKSYQNLFIVAKSLGTAALEQVHNPEAVRTKSIKSFFWITPYTNTSNLSKIDFDIPASDYFYVGTADQFYDKEVYVALSRNTTVREFQGLGHSFEVANDIIQSVKGLQKVLMQIRQDILHVTSKQ